jgi:hypothetical protein
LAIRTEPSVIEKWFRIDSLQTTSQEHEEKTEKSPPVGKSSELTDLGVLWPHDGVGPPGFRAVDSRDQGFEVVSKGLLQSVEGLVLIVLRFEVPAAKSETISKHQRAIKDLWNLDRRCQTISNRQVWLQHQPPEQIITTSGRRAQPCNVK